MIASRPPPKELGPVPPLTVFGVGKRYARGITPVPANPAARTLCNAVSWVNGGRGGRDIGQRPFRQRVWRIPDECHRE